MERTNSPSTSGLDGIVVAQTALSDVDGERGRLVIRGHSVEDLVERATFEDICGLMWHAAWPSPGEREALRAALSVARQLAFTLVNSLGGALQATDGMEALRAAVGHLRAGDPQVDRLRLTAAIPVLPRLGRARNQGNRRCPRKRVCRMRPTISRCWPAGNRQRLASPRSTRTSAASPITA